MVDIATERLVSLAEAARLLPPARGGRPVHPTTLLRAITEGRDGVKLEGLRVGGRWITSLEALQRWAECQTEAATRGPGGPEAGRRASRRTRHAAEELARLGF